MKNWLSAKDIQYDLHVSRATAYRMLGNLPTIRVGRCLRVSRADLLRAIQENDGVLPTSSGRDAE